VRGSAFRRVREEGLVEPMKDPSEKKKKRVGGEKKNQLGSQMEGKKSEKSVENEKPPSLPNRKESSIMEKGSDSRKGADNEQEPLIVWERRKR